MGDYRPNEQVPSGLASFMKSAQMNIDANAPLQRAYAEGDVQKKLAEQKAQLESQALSEESKKGMDLYNQLNKNAGPFGNKTGVTYGHFKADTSQPSATQMYGKLGEEAVRGQKLVDGQLKEHKAALQATEGTLDALDGGNIVDQKMGILNEAKLLGGARGAATFAKMLDPSNTALGWATKVENWITGNGDIELTPSMINNMRQYAYSRIDTLKKQYDPMKQQLSAQISQQAPLSAQMGSLGAIQASAFGDVDASYSRLLQRKQEYQKQQQQARTQGQGTFNNPQPAYSPNQSIFQKLGDIASKTASGIAGMFGGKPAAPQDQQPQQPEDNGMAAAIAAEKARRAKQPQGR